MRTSLRRFTVLTTAALAACSDASSREFGSWKAERETRGDTTIVRTESGSVWGEPIVPVEELAIGTLEGADHEMFGFVQELAVDSAGGIYVFDGQAPALRYYDAGGNYVRTLGGKGGGPGEYQDVALGLAIRKDGRILLRDPRNSRLNVYTPDGKPAGQVPVMSGLHVDNAMMLDTADQIYLKVLLEQPQRNQPWRIGLLHMDANGGIIDTIAPPRLSHEPVLTAGGVFMPQKIWAYSPLGYPVVGINSNYAFELHSGGSSVTRIIRDDHSAVNVGPEERAEWEAQNDWMRKNQGQFLTADIPGVPNSKPAYREINVARDGRIWVQRYTAAEKVTPPPTPESNPDRPPTRTWREPTVYDVFEPAGTYLGEVRIPARTSILVFGREALWGVRRGEADEQYVVRLALPTPGRVN